MKHIATIMLCLLVMPASALALFASTECDLSFYVHEHEETKVSLEGTIYAFVVGVIEKYGVDMVVNGQNLGVVDEGETANLANGASVRVGYLDPANDRAKLCMNAPSEHNDYKLYEGWNLVPFGQGIKVELPGAQVDAAYVYKDGQYYDVLKDDDVLYGIINEQGFTGVWVHLQEDVKGRLEVDLEEVEETLREGATFTFREGWNFYVATPYMNKDYPEGHFNFAIDDGRSVLKDDKIFAYAAGRDSWESGFYTEMSEEGEFSDRDVIGLPFIAYFQYRFSPEFVENAIPIVPDFPDF
ncbi:hypothetical protein CMO91_04770 [Candidatus Woesearchaeota archaeon]|nr:hypothetical protein [Candidatus Woesearchaeota archaeon]|tara:strand:+ start:1143 stop:2036 length:894 start_codon:yes stop_codon:yes gene_type:complete